MNDIVKYQNKLNDYPVFKLTEIEQNIFMSLLAQTSCTDEQWVSINLYDLMDKTNYWEDSVISFKDKVNTLLDKICNPKMRIETDKTIHIFVCFDELIYDKNTFDLKLHIQSTFFDMLKNYKLGFTRFELAEFVALSGSYTKTMYRFLKQFRTQGHWIVNIEEFRKLLNIPESYRQIDIDRRVLNPSIKQLSRELDLFDTVRVPFRNLKVEKIKKTGRQIKGGRGGTIVALKFSFDAEELKKIPEYKKDVHSETTPAPVASSINTGIPIAQPIKSAFNA